MVEDLTVGPSETLEELGVHVDYWRFPRDDQAWDSFRIAVRQRLAEETSKARERDSGHKAERSVDATFLFDGLAYLENDSERQEDSDDEDEAGEEPIGEAQVIAAAWKIFGHNMNGNHLDNGRSARGDTKDLDMALNMAGKSYFEALDAWADGSNPIDRMHLYERFEETWRPL
ncbi:hypothetical protein IAT40_001225 [Kwoniella sp. CBS 6097]